MDADTDDFPLRKIMLWVGGGGSLLAILGIALVWFGFD